MARAVGGLIFAPLYFALIVISSACGLREKVTWFVGRLLYFAKTAAKNQATHCKLGMHGLRMRTCRLWYWLPSVLKT